ncbi:unnamed protein product [Acidithrix sp. C25]|nr:unnamed protein product [Acidithrix sp. C25]
MRYFITKYGSSLKMIRLGEKLARGVVGVRRDTAYLQY